MLNPADQDHLRIPMQKLNECAAGLDGVQAAIDLRVALESLFLDDNAQGELSYRLALRVAIFTGGDLEHQKETRKRTTVAYRVCSKAVHTGRLSSNRADSDTIEWARDLVRKALCRMIRDGHGKQDWNDVELRGSHVGCVP